MTWQLDPAHSEIQFSVRHMMISKVRGQFEQFSGTFDFDETNPTQSIIKVEIAADSINTRNDQRDGHLKSPDFLDAANHPILTFENTNIEKIDDSHGRLTGNLTIKNTSHQVTLDVEHTGMAKNPFTGAVSAGFTAKGKVNRKDWGMTWNQALETGGILVGDDIEIAIELELVKTPETAGVAA